MFRCFYKVLLMSLKLVPLLMAFLITVMMFDTDFICLLCDISNNYICMYMLCSHFNVLCMTCLK